MEAGARLSRGCGGRRSRAVGVYMAERDRSDRDAADDRSGLRIDTVLQHARRPRVRAAVRAQLRLPDRSREPHESPDPPEALLARAYLEEFFSCEVGRMAAGRLGSKSDDAYRLADRRWRTVRSRAIAAFPGTEKADLSESKPGRTLGGQILPGPESGVKWLFDLLRARGGSPVTVDQVQGIYAFLSSGTHPSLYPARQMRVGATLRIEAEHLERLLGAAVITYYSTLAYVLSFYGADRTPIDQLKSIIDAHLPGYLT